MANSTQADVFYLRTREELLPFEDSILNALQQGTPNYYTPRNDQSIWGEIQRAVARELAKLEYYYAYDQVGKNSQFLTPPDIRRRWADPLFISRIFPQTNQSDLSFRTMLVELLQAYRQGATVSELQNIIFAYTGLTITVLELFKFIGQGFFDISDHNAITVSINVGGTNPFADITNLQQLQAITQTLYNALDLGKPAHVGLKLATVFGSDENIDLYVTAKDINVNDEAQIISLNPTLYGAALYGNGNYGNAFSVQVSHSPFDEDFGVSIEGSPATQFTRVASLYGVGPYGSVNYGYNTAPGPFQYTLNVFNGIGTYYFNAANAGQTVSISYSYVNNSLGIEDQLRIFVRIFEDQPLPPQLFLAPDTLPSTPATGLATVSGWPTNAFYGFGQTFNLNDSILDPSGFVQQVTSILSSPPITTGTSNPYWKANKVYNVGNVIRDLHNNLQVVTMVTGNQQSGPIVPLFNQAITGTTIDNNVTWTNSGIFTFNSTLNGTTTDNTIVWTNRGRPPGVLAPRINRAWEISQGDTFSGFLLV